MEPADSPRIAVIEDDDEIRALVCGLLIREGMTAHPCRTAAAFDDLRITQAIDLAIVDIMLPGEDGLSLCRRMRAAGGLPMLIVSARGDDVDRIVGLEVGADDYLPKPFNPRELLARVRALLRRSRAGNDTTPAAPRYLFAGWSWDADARALSSPDGVGVELTGGEHDLLLCLVAHPQRVLSRDQLLDWTRGRTADAFDRTIDVQVSRLRHKLDAAGSEVFAMLKTVRNAGYILAAPVRPAP